MKKVSVLILAVCLVLTAACAPSIRGKYAFSEITADADAAILETYQNLVDETAAIMENDFSMLTMEFKRGGKAVFRAAGQPDEEYNYSVEGGAVILTDENGKDAEEKLFGYAGYYSLKFEEGKVVIGFDLGKVIRETTGRAADIALRAVFRKI